MSEAQLYLTVAIAPVMTLVIVLAGYVVQNQNLNARIAEVRSDLDKRLSTEMNALREVLRAEIAVIRSEMARNHSELLSKFADLDRRLGPLEAEHQH